MAAESPGSLLPLSFSLYPLAIFIDLAIMALLPPEFRVRRSSFFFTPASRVVLLQRWIYIQSLKHVQASVAFSLQAMISFSQFDRFIAKLQVMGLVLAALVRVQITAYLSVNDLLQSLCETVDDVWFDFESSKTSISTLIANSRVSSNRCLRFLRFWERWSMLKLVQTMVSGDAQNCERKTSAGVSRDLVFHVKSGMLFLDGKASPVRSVCFPSSHVPLLVIILLLFPGFNTFQFVLAILSTVSCTCQFF